MNTLKRQVKILIASVVLCLMAIAAGCQQPVVTHKLVVTGNQHSIPLYADENDYLKYSRMQQSGGLQGMVGDVGKKMVTRQIDDQTPVKVVSSDDNGAVVEISSGAMRGETGFVAKQNLD